MADHYTYRTTWSPEDQQFVGLCAEFPSLSWFGDSHDEALRGVRALVAEVIADMQQNGEALPQALAEKQYSGELCVRIPPEQHRALAIQAAEQGVSLNRLVSSKLIV